MEKKSPKEEFQLSFDRPLALLDRVEQEPTALKLAQVKLHIKAGKELVFEDNWACLVGSSGAIKLAVSFMARSIAFSNLFIFSTATCAAGACKLPV